jgi:hypothetical protein
MTNNVDTIFENSEISRKTFENAEKSKPAWKLGKQRFALSTLDLKIQYPNNIITKVKKFFLCSQEQR